MANRVAPSDLPELRGASAAPPPSGRLNTSSGEAERHDTHPGGWTSSQDMPAMPLGNGSPAESPNPTVMPTRAATSSSPSPPHTLPRLGSGRVHDEHAASKRQWTPDAVPGPSSSSGDAPDIYRPAPSPSMMALSARASGGPVRAHGDTPPSSAPSDPWQPVGQTTIAQRGIGPDLALPALSALVDGSHSGPHDGSHGAPLRSVSGMVDGRTDMHNVGAAEPAEDPAGAGAGTATHELHELLDTSSSLEDGLESTADDRASLIKLYENASKTPAKGDAQPQRILPPTDERTLSWPKRRGSKGKGTDKQSTFKTAVLHVKSGVDSDNSDNTLGIHVIDRLARSGSYDGMLATMLDEANANGANGAPGTPDDPTLPLPKSPYGARDDRSEDEKLTDYLIALANPSQNMRKKDPKLTVFEEGDGGREGCRPEYWKQHFVVEPNLPIVDADDNAVTGRRDNTLNRGLSIGLRRSAAEVRKKSVEVWRTPDNEVFCCSNAHLNEFYHLGGYRAFPKVVGVELLVRELTNIEATTSSFHVSFTIGLRWYDPVFDTAQYWGKCDDKVFARSIPYVTLKGHDRSNLENIGVPLDADDPSLSDLDRHCGMVVLRKDGKDPPGVLYHKITVEATFKKAMRLQMFPFDRQELMMRLQLCGGSVKTDDDYGRVLIPINVDMSLDTPHDEWYVFVADAVSTGQRGEQQELEVQVNVRRRPAYFIINVISVISVLTTLSFTAYAQDNSWDYYGDRCQITLTLMLTSIAYKFFIADQIPKVSYLTVLDWYIYLGILTTASILLFNTAFLCKDMDDCEEEIVLERTTMWAVAGVWATGNICIIVLIVWYIIELLYTDFDRRQYAKDGEEKLLARQLIDDKAKLDARRKQHRFHTKERRMLWMRRRAALRELLALEKRQFYIDALADQSSVDPEHARMYSRVVGDSMPNIKTRDKKVFGVINEENNADAATVDTHLKELFRRADMTKSLATLGPLLAMAELTPERLQAIYHDGLGVTAALALLDEAGVRELNEKIRLLDALTQADKVHDIETVKPVKLVVLQGSASYLWNNATKDGAVPMPRTKFLAKVTELKKVSIAHFLNPEAQIELEDDRKRSKSPQALAAHHSPTPPLDEPSFAGRKKKLQEKSLMNLANAIMGDIMLNTVLGNSAQFVYAARQVDGAAKGGKSVKLHTQVWVGYLLKKSKELVLPEENYAISMDIGTGKIALGFAKPIDPGMPIEAVTLNSGSNTTVIDSTNLTELLKEAVQNQLPSAEYRAKSNTDTMHEICEAMLTLLREVFQLAEREHPDAFEEKFDAKDMRPVNHTLSIFLFGTSKLRDWQEGLDEVCGTRPLELMEAVAEWCTRKLNARTGAVPGLKKNVNVNVVFEVIPAAYEAECEREAFVHALEHKKSYKGWDSKLVSSFTAPANGPSRGRTRPKRKFDDLGNLAWGGGSCQGIISSHSFALETGLKKITAMLTKQIDAKVMRKRSLRMASLAEEDAAGADEDEDEAVRLTVAELKEICDKQIKKALVAKFEHESPLCAQIHTDEGKSPKTPRASWCNRWQNEFHMGGGRFSDVSYPRDR